MKCPYCSAVDIKVIDKRESDDFESTRRRRECLKCGKRFTTYERVEIAPVIVVKKDGNREQFEPRKIMLGLMRACEKRPIPNDKLQKIVKDIEIELRTKESIEVPSKVIGELVMDKLKELDEVAYVRFASVYRQFKDAKQFMKEIEKKLFK